MKGLRLRLSKQQVEATQGAAFVDQLKMRLSPYREGNCPVQIDYINAFARVPLTFGAQWHIKPTEPLLQSLKELLGEDAVSFEY